MMFSAESYHVQEHNINTMYLYMYIYMHIILRILYRCVYCNIIYILYIHSYAHCVNMIETLNQPQGPQIFSPRNQDMLDMGQDPWSRFQRHKTGGEMGV